MDIELRWNQLAFDAAAVEPAPAPLSLRLRDGRLEAAGSLMGLATVTGDGELDAESFALELDLTGGRLDRLATLAPSRDRLPDVGVAGPWPGGSRCKDGWASGPNFPPVCVWTSWSWGSATAAWSTSSQSK